MKKYFVMLSAVVAMLVASCSGDKTNPIWGMWTLPSESPVKTEIMFTDDFTGFVFVADTVQFETSWQQDSVLRVNYFDMAAGRKGLGIQKIYSVTVDGDVLTLKDKKSGEVTKYSRFVE